MIYSKSLKVTGKVQGVFFRNSAKEKADELGIKGTVRNEKDGSVFIEAEGEPAQMEKFISWCHKGPIMARVDQVIVEDGIVRHFSSFEVVRH